MSNLPLLYFSQVVFSNPIISIGVVGYQYPTSKSKQGRLNFTAFQSKQRLFAVQAARVAG